MDYDDSDWTVAAEQPAAGSPARWSPLSLLAGVALGAAAASGVWWALAGPPGGRPAEAAAPRTAASAVSAAAAAASSVAPATALAETVPAAAPSASGALVDADERKARAWARYYQRPAFCEGNPSTEQLVECANHFIRSKRQFDAEWAAGRL
ncbi:MAG TPA: hypothetical protein VFQ16_02595 [Burkholderiaceae bacterium]|nr:hypothetical protein [Burkholderiaceae bacterium]